MSAPEVLALLRERGVDLWVDGDQLRYKGSEEVMTPDLIEEIIIKLFYTIKIEKSY